LSALNKQALSRILVVKMSSLGDLFHALPTVHSLKTATHASIDWLVNREYADTVACFKDVERVIAFPRRDPPAKLLGFRHALREREYDLAVDLQGLLKSAAVTLQARAARRIGPSFSRELAHLLYRENAGKKNKERHAVEECLDLLRYLELPIDMSPPPVSFPNCPVELPKPYVAIAPRSRWRTKDWTEAGFIALGRSIASRTGRRVCVLGGPPDAEACARIAEGIGPAALNLAGRTSIPELGGVLAQADLLVSVDSGPVHIAAALDTPVLGLYGITDPQRTGPYGDRHRVIRSPLAGRRHGDFRRETADNMSVMQAIQPETVITAALEMLSASE
jgi:heptosyltransferase I